MPRSILPCVALLLLGACGESPDNSNEPGVAEPAAAPAAPTQAPIPTEGESDGYGLIKAAALDTARTELAEAAAAPGEQGSGEARSFDVVDCRETDRNPELLSRTDRPALEERLALRVARLEIRLAAGGYAPAGFRAPLRRYEEWALATIREKAPAPSDFQLPALTTPEGDAALARFAAEVEAARARQQPDLPPLVAQFECGAGEAEFIVRTEPGGGRVWLATRFGFNLCKARRLDPWNRERCDRWTEVDPDRPTRLSGTYAYQARWPRGVAGRGVKKFEWPVGNPAEPPVILVRPD